ncbi:MAG: hypothetical protein M3H12_00550 [Chromatiales bacterium]
MAGRGERSFDDILHDYTFIGLDLARRMRRCLLSAGTQANLCIEINFRTALMTTENVIALDEFESVLGIDKNRNVIYDF